MPREIKPIEDDELAGLVMAMTAEAQRAGWDCRYGIQGDGSLVLLLHHPEKKFELVTADNGRRKMTIATAEFMPVEVTADTPEGN